ncbi:hypothetical protein [Frondihabitans sp. PhB188]|uniref:relaxase/mobilization nuclease domain-containing protein n=1 Tax=Frondihabitans sp. PhB188 TaxID=2485200 RepID=UPI0011CE6636|nr:hypothetical protein [Frondihabitans sp. PhB188]
MTDVKPDYDLKRSTEYLVLGTDAKRKKHLAGGTNRLVPGFYCDAPDVASFVALGDDLARRHSRKVKAQSYVLSFSPQELSVDSDADLHRVGDVAFLLAKKMHPHSPCLVVVHADGKGRAPHAHVKVLNHNTVTGKALADYRTHWQVKQANDELMREVGHDILDVHRKYTAPEWSRQRSRLTPFEVELGDRVAAARDDALRKYANSLEASQESFLGSFRAACERLGVRLEVQEHRISHGGRDIRTAGSSVQGFIFAMRDESMPVPRLKRRKASFLSEDFTHEALVQSLEQMRRQPSPEAARPGRPRQVSGDDDKLDLADATTHAVPATAGIRGSAFLEAPAELSFAKRMRSALDEADQIAHDRSAESIEEYLSSKSARAEATESSTAPSAAARDEAGVSQGEDSDSPQDLVSVFDAASWPTRLDGAAAASGPDLDENAADTASALAVDRLLADSHLVNPRVASDAAEPIAKENQAAVAAVAAERDRRRRLARIRAEVDVDDSDRDTGRDGPSLA